MSQNIVWEDKEIRFDIPNTQKKLHGGEVIFDSLDSIEDTKGNTGDNGSLLVTNLRLFWYSLTTNKFNLSIGYYNILTMNTKTVTSKGRSTTQALHILCVFNNSRFEFIFSNLHPKGTQAFASVFDVYRIYQNTMTYRELKLRGAIISCGQLNVLRYEQVYNIISGIWNLSSDQGNLGVLIISNIRIVWFADMNETFNISLPYLQIQTIKIRDSKYGQALVIQTLETAGNYTLGFRVDPQDKLDNVYREISAMYDVYSITPIFGMTYERKTSNSNIPEVKQNIELDDELDDSRENRINTTFTAYLTDDGDVDREPAYCKELGFAMEKIKDGFTLKDLWDVIP